MKFVRFEINIWSVDDTIDNRIVSITKVEYLDLDGDKFNEFVNWKLKKIKELIDEL